ncbi:putative MFS hexose transporter [Hyaloscypha variabilis F]|uniref:Putative MFS hexose transporter n=1 Tax=Hyaloscypha variabilis (strain UAMH 11265 / GT02V1 / F) TaxID=1149755 RepID=A0A2J6SAH1_HYAVF|nr:putative MFS hexose transporter [Hyaloscypha variabilis F]
MTEYIPFDLNGLQPWYKRPERILLYCGLLPAVLVRIAVGFDQSMTNALQTVPAFLDFFHHPHGSTLGFFGAAQSLGGVLAVFLGPFLADKWGRRLPMFIGSMIIICSTFGQTWAVNFSMFCAFKFVIGIGIGITQLGSAPLITELAHPKERVALTNFYNTSIYLGYIIGAWVTYSTFHLTTEWSWRIPCILQIMCSTYQMLFIYLCPESPRWLIANERQEEAKALLLKCNALVDWEYSEISQAIALEQSETPSLKELAMNRGLLWRAFICVCCGVFSQTSGNGLVSSYFPEILPSAGVTQTKTVTLINGCNSIWSWLVAIICAFNVNIFVGWTIAQARYDITGVQGAGYAVLALIFLNNAAYSYCWLFLVITYPLEVAPYKWRAKLWALVVLSISISAFFNQYVNPIGLENAGWKHYVYYDIWILIEIIIVYFFFP